MLISLPHPRRPRNHASYFPEKAKESIDTPSPPPQGDPKDAKHGSETEDTSFKGKKRSLEYGHDSKANYDYDDEDGLPEVAFGTVIIPFEEKG